MGLTAGGFVDAFVAEDSALAEDVAPFAKALGLLVSFCGLNGLSGFAGLLAPPNSAAISETIAEFPAAAAAAFTADGDVGDVATGGVGGGLSSGTLVAECDLDGFL